MSKRHSDVAVHADREATGVRPLEGLRVAELDHSPALAVCGKYFAGLGADVVDFAIASRGGDAALADYLGDGKRAESIAFDSSEEAYDVLLCAQPPADVPASTVVVVISDFGRTGPLAYWAGSDFLAQAASGIMSIVGDAEDAPLALGGHQIEYTAGVAAFSAAMVALQARDRDGLGQVVETSLLEAAAYVEWKGRIFGQVGNDLQRGDLSGPMVISCADGHFGFYYRPTDWHSVVRAFDSFDLADARFATQSSRNEHRSELIEQINGLSRVLDRDELYRRLQAENIPAGPVLEAADLLESVQYRVRAFFAPLIDSEGTQPHLPVTFNGRRVSPSRPVPVSNRA